MKTWTYLRIDRIESGEVHRPRCVFCGRGLSSGRLIVLRDESGMEAYAGPSCAKNHLGAPTEPILDLSKMAMMLVLKQNDVDSNPGAGRPDDPRPKRAGRAQALEVDEVAQYLCLRAEYMPGFSGNATQRLREFHEQLGTPAGLSDEARLYVERLLAKAKSANSIYSFRNVERCIGAAFWLRIAIEQTRPERREFLERMLVSLHKYWRLTQKQIEAVNRWGEGVRKQAPDFPILDADAFEGVHAPHPSPPQNNAS